MTRFYKMHYIRNISRNFNKQVFCIEPKSEDKKQLFKILLAHKSNTIIKDKIVFKKT